jgi:DNA-directed RNA polymerase specialized sigma subunit
MTIKEYLNQARMLDKRIDSKLEQVERLRALAERTTTVLSSQPKGAGGANRTEYCIERIWQLEKEVTEDIDILVDMRQDIRGAIEGMENDRYKLLMECRYLCGNTWEQIAEKMEIEVRWVYELHGRALQEICIRAC